MKSVTTNPGLPYVNRIKYTGTNLPIKLKKKKKKKIQGAGKAISMKA